MATAGSKGNRKRTSALQKAHYQAYKLINKRRSNMIKRLKQRIRRNAAEIVKKAKRTPPRVVRKDRGAIAALDKLTNS